VDVTNTGCNSPNCTISAAGAKSGSSCIPPDSQTQTSVHWNPRSSPGYSQFGVFLTCT
jgi:hypothetical protein